MTTLTLSDEERDTLAQTLGGDLRALQNEINHTDDHRFRASLLHRAPERIRRPAAARSPR
jgi:hypothetical protein